VVLLTKGPNLGINGVMSDKIKESLAASKANLDATTKLKFQLENELKLVDETIHQLKGAIAALEYVLTLSHPTDTVTSNQN
jgi:hypothetical protein